MRRPGLAVGHMISLSENDHRSEPERLKHPSDGRPFGVRIQGRTRLRRAP
ncbi:hypothetical protein BN2537_5009 [Streptomyces venezuelae]|nr:hypothetical protein BN2537_5009 [Streptomyces venezuelae]